MRSAALAVSLSFAYLLLSGCGKKEDAVPAAPAPATTTAPVSAQSQQELEAESSLSVKRGIMTLTSQTRTFRMCGATVDLTLTEQPEVDSALNRVYADMGSKPIYAELYGDRGEPQGSQAVPTTFNVEELLYATTENPAGACSQAAGTYELQARGSEPSWSIDVQQDTMLFKQTSAPTEIKFAAVETADTEGTVTYRAGADRHVLELVITQRTCRNATTNEYYAYSATARLDKQTLSGCARVGG